MGRKGVLRYLIWLAVVMVCVGIAWYFSRSSGHAGADVVLAKAAETVWPHTG